MDSSGPACAYLIPYLHKITPPVITWAYRSDDSFVPIIGFCGIPRDEQRYSRSRWMKRWRNCTFLHYVRSSHPAASCCGGHRNSHHLWNGKQSRARECRISLSLVSDGVFHIAAFQQIIFNADSPILKQFRRCFPQNARTFIPGRLEWIPITLSLLSSDSARCPPVRGSPRTKIRAESSSNGSDLRSASFTPQKIRAELSSNGSSRVSFGQKLPEFHDSGEKAQELMKEFFLFNLIGFSKTSPLGMATLSWTSSLRLPLIRCIIWSWTYYRGGTGRVVASIYCTGRIVMDVLFPWYGRIDATWYVTSATQFSINTSTLGRCWSALLGLPPRFGQDSLGAGGLVQSSFPVVWEGRGTTCTSTRLF